MKKKLKQIKGITLIALVVTIVVLLILAGITITFVFGENGVIKKAKDSKEITERQDIIGIMRVEILSKQTENLGKITETELTQVLEKYGTLSGDGAILDKTLKTDNGAFDIKVSEIWNGTLVKDENEDGGGSKEPEQMEQTRVYAKNYKNMDWKLTTVFSSSDITVDGYGELEKSYGEDILYYNLDSYGPPEWLRIRETDGTFLGTEFGRVVIYDKIAPNCTNHWFQGCGPVSGLENLITNNVTSMFCMFSDSTATELDLSHFDTSNVTNMHGMFGNCRKLEILNLSNFNTSRVTDMSWMFCCGGDEIYKNKLRKLDLSSFDTSNVTNMESMFDGCSNLVELDLSSFDISSSTNVKYMLVNCSSLETVYVKTEKIGELLKNKAGAPETTQFIVK